MKGTNPLSFGTTAALAFWTTAVALSLFANSSAAEPGDNSLVSLNPASQRPAGHGVAGVSISGSGRYVAFDSKASTLVPGDTNGWADIFVRDRVTGITERVSVGIGGAEPNWQSESPSISADGRYVVFESRANNLVSGDSDDLFDVYLYDRQSGLTRRASVRTDGTGFGESCSSGGVSNDGRYVAFECRLGVYLRDMTAGTTLTLVQAGDVDYSVSINGNGRYVLYRLNYREQLYVYDRLSGSTQSVAGLWGVFSDDGRWFAYASDASDVPGDVNGLRDIYLLDRSTGAKRLVSVGADGRQSTTINYGVVAVSRDGRYVAFSSDGDGLLPGFDFPPDRIQLLLKDMQSGSLEYVASWWYGASLSDDGHLLAFNTELAMVTNDRNGSYFSYDDIDTYVHEVGQSSAVPLVYIYQLRPSRIDFGSVPISSSSSKGFMLTNSGSNTALPITVVELAGPNRQQFTVKNTCRSPITFADRCWISVAFSPTSVGYKQARLHVVAGGIARDRALTGTGERQSLRR